MQIICLLVAIAVAGLIVAALHASHHRRGHLNYVAGMSHQIGTELIAQTNSASLMHLDPGFRAKLVELLASQTSVSLMQFGDEPPPLGDGKAHTRLTLTNASGQTLTMRLRADSKSNRFQILSYSTTQPETATLP